MKRATLFIFKGVYRLADFNPRPREEGDDSSANRIADLLNISIHALVKRATPKGQKYI